jgi:hypothetical protein
MNEETHRWDFFSPNILERTLATRAEKTVTTIKKIGITHSSLSFAVRNTRLVSILLIDKIWDAPGFKKNATLENSRAGVNKEMLIWFITCISDKQIGKPRYRARRTR